MKSFLDFLFAHKIIAAFLSLTYYLLVVLPHEQVGELLAKYVGRPLGRSHYNNLVLIISFIGLAMVAFMLYRKFSYMDDYEKKHLIRYYAIWICLMLLALKIIIVINVELIHVVQYAFMSILIYPLLGNFKDVFLISSFLGALDEWYQYVILAPAKNDYFDFNDVIINMLGIVLGLLLIRSFYGAEKKRFQWRRSTGILVLGTVFTGVVVFMSLGYLSLRCPSDSTVSPVVFCFIREFHPGFWHTVPKAEPFHIVRPWEALIIIPILFLIFKDIGRQQFLSAQK